MGLLEVGRRIMQIIQNQRTHFLTSLQFHPKSLSLLCILSVRHTQKYPPSIGQPSLLQPQILSSSAALSPKPAKLPTSKHQIESSQPIATRKVLLDCLRGKWWGSRCYRRKEIDARWCTHSIIWVWIFLSLPIQAWFQAKITRTY